MGGKQTNKKQYTGEITSGIKPRTSRLAIINFVYQQLPFWRDDTERLFEQSEPKLNLQLCDFLDCRAREDLPMFRFCHEEIQSGTRSVDLSVKSTEKRSIEAHTYSKYEPVLVVECKRLPAPLPKDREKEYVTGTQPNKISGGIQRFKLGLHGAKHNLAVMIGYLQSHTNRYWYAKINSWILELVKEPIGDGCVWIAGETLKEFEANTSNGIYRYHSIHSRTGEVGNNEIQLHHLWVVMNNNR